MTMHNRCLARITDELSKYTELIDGSSEGVVIYYYLKDETYKITHGDLELTVDKLRNIRLNLFPDYCDVIIGTKHREFSERFKVEFNHNCDFSFNQI